MGCDKRQIINPPQHSRPIGRYSAGVSVLVGPSAKMVFVSGQVPTDENGTTIGFGDVEAQTNVVFDRIEAVLSEAGGSVEDLVSLTIYLVDMGDFEAVSKVRNRRLAKFAPASTLVEVGRLASQEHRVEINAIAVVTSV